MRSGEISFNAAAIFGSDVIADSVDCAATAGAKINAIPSANACIRVGVQERGSNRSRAMGIQFPDRLKTRPNALEKTERRELRGGLDRWPGRIKYYQDRFWHGGIHGLLSGVRER